MASPQSQPQPIPFGHNSSHFVHIYNNLVGVLTQIKAIKGLSAKILWVSCRLNRSREKEASPVFAGWVEDTEAINIRVKKQHPYAPIEIRFGDTHRSTLYSDCVNSKTPLRTVVPRNWGKADKADATSQRIGETFYGETHRRSIPIVIGDLYVGTLNAAFFGDPVASDEKIRDILIDWAQTEKLPLVKYVKDNLDYSGPRHP
jgi:hypothetical protein